MFGLTNAGIPRHRVRDAVDVVPAAGVEADEVRPERGADLHQLEARFELLDEHVDLDRAGRQAEVLLERRRACRSTAPPPRPSGSSAGRGRSMRPSSRSALRGCSRRTARGRRSTPRSRAPSACAHVAVVEMQAARAEDPRREVELLAPVVDDRAAEETLAPRRSSRPRPARRPSGTRGRAWIASFRLRWLSSDIVDDLAERVLAVEHPAVGARQQRVGDVADALLDRRVAACAAGPVPWIHCRCRSARDLAAVERAVARVLHADARARRSARRGSRNAMRCALARARCAPRDARRHQLPGGRRRAAPAPRAPRAPRGVKTSV